MERISGFVTDPAHSVFKTQANARPRVFTISCSNKDQCDFYKVGECSMAGVGLRPRCPYGSSCGAEGPTKRAKGYATWVMEQKDAIKGLPHLRSPSRLLARVGDFVFLDFSYMHEVTGVRTWLPKEQFTVDLVVKLCDFRPRNTFFDEIPAYQRDEVPKFIRQLATTFPEMFQEVCQVYPRALELLGERPNVGRRAVLRTLNANVGTFKDIHGGVWTWDGVHLTSTNSRASFVLVDTFSEVRVTPTDTAVVTITDEAQVTENTVFVS